MKKALKKLKQVIPFLILKNTKNSKKIEKKTKNKSSKKRNS